MKRTNYSSGASWEDIVGYSRAVRVGNLVEVAGTTAVQDGKVVAIGDMFGQAKFIFEKIEAVLNEAGAKMSDVIRTRMYITNIEDFEAAGKAHALFFKNIKPSSTLVEVSALVNPDMLIEIEITAMISETQ